MWLLDTNIVLEMLLDQAQAEDVGLLLRSPQVSPAFLSDFSLYSLGIWSSPALSDDRKLGRLTRVGVA